MTPDRVTLIYAALFLGVLFLVEGLYYLIVDLRGRQRDPNRRLRMLAAGNAPEKVLVTLRRERRFRRSGGWSPMGWFEGLVIQAGITTPPLRVLTMMVAGGVVVGMAMILLHRTVAIAAGAGFSVGLAMPLLFMVFRRRRRLRRFAQQLPDAVEIIVRSLRAGHPVPTAVGMVAREMSDPIGSEFGIAVDEMTYGLDLDQALKNMAERVGLPDLDFLVVAVTVQIQVGGNLAEILSNLARMIRERFRMRLKIKALSAEGRFSAVVLSILPVVMIGVINLISPNYYGEVYDDPLFLPVMAFGFILMLIGIYVMYRLVNFRV